MLPVPVAPGATQQSHHALCVEELDFFDVDALMTNGDAQVQEDVKDIVRLEELLSSKETQNSLFEEVDASVFESVKMWSLSQADPNTSVGNPLIPLSVQQAQMDSIDPQLISNSDWVVHDNFTLSPVLVCADDGTASQSAAAAASLSQLPAATQGSSADQTVPFRRHDSTCSMMSCSSEVKSERCSVSDTETAMLSLLSTAPRPAACFTSRRGRPSSANLNDDSGLTEKQIRRRAQNRRAATKCRHKRRAEFEQLKQNHDVVTRQNEQLTTQLFQLTAQLHRLQSEFAQHQQKCGLRLPAANHHNIVQF